MWHGALECAECAQACPACRSPGPPCVVPPTHMERLVAMMQLSHAALPAVAARCGAVRCGAGRSSRRRQGGGVRQGERRLHAGMLLDGAGSGPQGVGPRVGGRWRHNAHVVHECRVGRTGPGWVQGTVPQSRGPKYNVARAAPEQLHGAQHARGRAALSPCAHSPPSLWSCRSHLHPLNHDPAPS